MRIVLLAEGKFEIQKDLKNQEGVIRQRKEAAYHQSEIYIQRI